MTSFNALTSFLGGITQTVEIHVLFRIPSSWVIELSGEAPPRYNFPRVDLGHIPDVRGDIREKRHLC